MVGIHEVDDVRFEYGDYRVYVTLKYWESMPTRGGDEAYHVEVTARHQTSRNSISSEKKARVWQTKGPRGLWDAMFGESEREKVDVTQLVQDAWNEARQKIDRISERTSGEVTVDFEAATEAAKESSDLNSKSHIDRELDKLGGKT